MNSSDHERDVLASITDFNNIVRRFGFWPANSVVARWFNHDGEILVQRVDLPPTNSEHEWMDGFLQPLQFHRPSRAQIWLTSADLNRNDALLVDLIISGTRQLGMGDVFLYRIDAENIHLQSCTNCIPAHKWNLLAQNAVCMGTRSELETEFAYKPVLGISSKVMLRAGSLRRPDSRTWRENEATFLRQIVDLDQPPADTAIARAAQALSVIRVRDAFLWDLAAGEISSESAAAVFSAMLPHVRGDLGVPLATVAGTSWWLAGNGAKANMCIERAQHGTTGYSLATLVRAALSAGLPPQFWIDGVLELTRTECLHGGKVA